MSFQSKKAPSIKQPREQADDRRNGNTSLAEAKIACNVRTCCCQPKKRPDVHIYTAAI